MNRAIGEFNRRLGSTIEVEVIENSFFGPEINISGLLTAGDLIRTFAESTSTSPVYISSRMISDRTQTLLDDLTLSELEAEIGRPIVPCLTLADVGRDLRHRLRAARAA
jgi:NifB/MoaA-like Fe-S oxidoreductase